MIADGIDNIRQLGWMRSAVVRFFRIGRRLFMIVFHEGGDFLLRLFVVEPPVDGAEGSQFDVPLRPADDDGGVEAFVNGGSGCAADGCENAVGIADERRRVVLRLDDALVGHVVALRDDAFWRAKEIVDQIDEMDDLRDEHAAAFAVPFAVPVVAVVGIWTETAEIDGRIEDLSEATTVQELLEQQVEIFRKQNELLSDNYSKLKEMFDTQVEANIQAKEELKRSKRFNIAMMIIAIIAMLAAIAGPIATIWASK